MRMKNPTRFYSDATNRRLPPFSPIDALSVIRCVRLAGRHAGCSLCIARPARKDRLELRRKTSPSAISSTPSQVTVHSCVPSSAPAMEMAAGIAGRAGEAAVTGGAIANIASTLTWGGIESRSGGS